jgi:hypothetical protein
MAANAAVPMSHVSNLTFGTESLVRRSVALTDSRTVMSTGSPLLPVEQNDRTHAIGQAVGMSCSTWQIPLLRETNFSAYEIRNLFQLHTNDMTFGFADVFYLMDHRLAPTNQSKLSEVVLRLMASLGGSGVEV